MSKIEPVCSLSNLNKFKCYTQSGSKKVYEDDGLYQLQSFIIFPNKTILSTGECEYTIGLTGNLADQHPWKDWTYTPPSDAVVGTRYSYEITGGPMPLSNYKGVIVSGIPSKKWTWDIFKPEDTTKTLSVTIKYNVGGSNTQGKNTGYYIQEVSYYEKTSDFLVPDNRTQIFSSGTFTQSKSSNITIDKGKTYTLYCWVYICLGNDDTDIGTANAQTTLTVSNGKLLGSSTVDDFSITYDFDSSAKKLSITVDSWNSGSSGGEIIPLHS